MAAMATRRDEKQGRSTGSVRWNTWVLKSGVLVYRDSNGAEWATLDEYIAANWISSYSQNDNCFMS